MIKRKTNTVRIISGQWRRRLLYFPEIPGLRPTHDRIRETLFNWLMPYTEGARCLDLFAGSGALGFEALSRGASAVSFVDNHPKVIAYIKGTADQLGADPQQIEAVLGSCRERPLSLSFSPYDIVFADPPFQNKHLSDIAAWLESNQCLAKDALIYVEMEKQREPVTFSGWASLKEGHTNRVSYFLFRRES